MSLTVTALEHSLIRVFALSMDDTAAKALRDSPDQQATLLGVTSLDTNYTEVFPLSDLDEIGLTGYLMDGNGVQPEALARDRAKLKALEGWVLILYSKALHSITQTTLTPGPELTLIGTYSEPGTDWTPTAPLISQAATEPGPTAKKKPSDAAMSGRIASLVLILLFALTGLMIWIAA